MKNQLNPLLARQLTGGARRSRFFWLVSFHVLLQGLIAFGFLRLGGMATSSESDARISLAGLLSNARQLYWLSSLLLLLTGGLLAPIAAIGGLAGEMEHRTFDLLRITTLSPRAIVLGKWGAAILTGLLLLLTPIPVQLLGFWLGGVTLTELLLTQVFLFVVLMLNTALALAISARVRKTWIAVLIFYGIVLAAVPIIGGGALLVVLYGGWYVPVSSTQPLWQMALAQHGWVLLTGVHPLSAAIASVILGTEQGAWFWLTFPIMGAGITPTVTLPAPWFTHTLLALPITAVLLWWTARRMARPEV
ncbi:MAG: hypothetical protein RBT75_04040 [Anaerolineae bacterium]|nr:hypothetical protein [Anaerolineae bacterium]